MLIKLEKELSDICRDKGITISVAESCTGGLVSSRITDISGSSAYFKGAVVAYSDQIKTALLNVPSVTIARYGAVSSETAALMAEGVRQLTGTDAGVSVTGIAGPGGGSPEKPVGLAFIGYSDGIKDLTERVELEGDRITLKELFSKRVIEVLIKGITARGRE